MVELGISQPIERKIHDQTGKYLVRKLASQIIPRKVSEAPKRALQTPQREWLANDLSEWISPLLHFKSPELTQWFDSKKVNEAYKNYRRDLPDNSFYIWQLINAALLLEQ